MGTVESPRKLLAARPTRSAKRSLPLARACQLLEPGPAVLRSTSLTGRANVRALSWLTMMEFGPPLLGRVISDHNFSCTILKATRECVINIPTVELSKPLVGCGNATGRTTDTFAGFDLTPVPASRVAAPLIAECYANLESLVFDTGMTARYSFLVLEVGKAWLDPARKDPRTLPHRGTGSFMVAGETVKLPSKTK